VATPVEARRRVISRAVVVRAWGAVVAIGFTLLVAHLAAGVGGHDSDHFFNMWLYDGLEVLAATGCFLRVAWTRSERAAWLALALGMLSFAAGDICFDFVYAGNPPTPSIADPLWLGLYPGCYAALGLLVRSRISTFNRSVWLDGVIAALASASVAAAIVFEVVFDNRSGSESAMIVNLAYPIGDVLLLALVVFVFALTGWRPGRAWTTVGTAFAVITVADSIFLYLNATTGYAEGTLLDVLWPASLLLLAASAFQTAGREHALELEGRFFGATPLACGMVALAVLLASHFSHLNLLAVGLAAGAIVTVLLRTAISFHDNTLLLSQTRSQSLTDSLTGLGNRRRLMLDLDRHLRAESSEPTLLLILDLNGFKRYNDSFGHPSGDTLLARLAGKLAQAAQPAGAAYRLGGDEFCILAPLAGRGAGAQIDAALAALSEEGEGFTVSASFGAAILPEEATDSSGALRLADEHLYAQKTQLYQTRESNEVLLRALTQREPSLLGVVELSVAVGSRLELKAGELKELRLAAELHDVGKLAIPDAVLQKPGALSDEDWSFIRQHTAIGQHIVAGAPALQGIGAIVRATHERWDGDGYGDGLSANDIPLAARIIAVCDAYAAMTSDRPYRKALAPAEALAELRRCSGTQFDPDIVRVFCCMQEEAGRLKHAEAIA
jgi:two-component system cell cycle response regulator